MPDLSLKNAHQYWSEYQDPIVYKAIVFMETVENWTLDANPELESALEKLGKELDDIKDIKFSEMPGHEEKIVRLTNYIKITRVLYLLQSIDVVHPGAAAHIIGYAEENSEKSEDIFGLFIQRNIAFERFRLLHRICSKERLDLISRALNAHADD